MGCEGLSPERVVPANFRGRDCASGGLSPERVVPANFRGRDCASGG
jgi:hypothetical protein